MEWRDLCTVHKSPSCCQQRQDFVHDSGILEYSAELSTNVVQPFALHRCCVHCLTYNGEVALMGEMTIFNFP